MADNLLTSEPEGSGATIATDEIDGVHYTRSKLIHGADGTNDGDVSKANPLPVGGNTAANGAGTETRLVTDTDGHPQVDVLSSALPSGAATSAAQTTGNASLSSIDGKITAVNTGAVVVSSSALPSGAATEAKQDDEIAAAEAIQAAVELIDDAVAAEGAALGKGVLLQGDDGTDRTNVLVDVEGHLQVDVLTSGLPSGAATSAKQDTLIGHVDGIESGLTDAVTALQVIDDWDETNRAKVNPIVGNAGVTAGAGAVDAGTQRVILATDDPAVAKLTTMDADTSAMAGCVGGTEMQVDVVAALPAGTNNIGDVDIASIAAGDNNIGNVDIASAIPAGTNKIGAVNLEAHTSGGWTTHSHISDATDEDAEVVKASAGQLGWVFVTNVDDAVAYLKFYNKATAPDENDTPVLRLAVPGNAAGAGLTFQVPPGLVFGTGISYRLTTAVADNSTAAVTANEVLVNVGYK